MATRFVAWRLTLAPGAVHASRPAEWSDALVIVDAGIVEVVCETGSRARFVAGDLIALSALPLRELWNPGIDEARLIAVRRAVDLLRQT